MDVILLAAGMAKRFGSNKLLLEVNGEKVYRYAAKLYLENESIDRRIIVSAYDEVLFDLENMGYIPVKNENSEWGISHSIKLGISKLLEDGEIRDGILFAVSDQPLLKYETVKRLIEVYEKNRGKIVSTAYNDRLGNPVIFDKCFVEELMELSGDVGGKKIAKNHMDKLVSVKVCDEKELNDIDSVEDFIKIKRMLV